MNPTPPTPPAGRIEDATPPSATAPSSTDHAGHADRAAPVAHAALDADLRLLHEHRQAWVRTPLDERIALLDQIKHALMPVAQAWADSAARHKGIAADSPLVGEEWTSGPYALMSWCNGMRDTLAALRDGRHLAGLALRERANGQLAARVMPHTRWDRLLLSGVRAEVWMQPGVTRANLARHSAAAYQPSAAQAPGAVALVLGAGNIAAIAPLDALHKLYAENQVVLLKLNPVNGYLAEFLTAALGPLIERGVLRIVQGDAAVGQYLCTHPLVEQIHITGSGAAHDQIVWGAGAEAVANKAAGTPQNTRRITSELGAVGPTLVVPGPWSDADIAFQAEHVATQKLHNAGFNCIACQVLVVAQGWPQKERFLAQLRRTLAATAPRPLYYPGAAGRLRDFQAASGSAAPLPHTTDQCLVTSFEAGHPSALESTEVFAPALSVTELPGDAPEAFLRAAIDYANTQLYGTLGANLLIHPATLAQIGRARFDELLGELRYGCIAVNAWTGLGFLLSPVPWGAFPGHPLDDVQSGIGVVHNTLLFERSERTVIEAPFQPFPRGLARGSFALLPRPPWFVTNRRAAVLGRLLTRFQYRPSWAQLPRIWLNALRG